MTPRWTLALKTRQQRCGSCLFFHSVPHLVKVALNRGKVRISLRQSWLSVLDCICHSLYTLHCIKVDWLNHLYAATANRLLMVPRLIGGWSVHKDIRICLFHHMHARTHACMHTHTHTHYWYTQPAFVGKVLATEAVCVWKVLARQAVYVEKVLATQPVCVEKVLATQPVCVGKVLATQPVCVGKVLATQPVCVGRYVLHKLYV